jgi:cystathionine beta-lyase/cystathionine gamma-synthase
MFNLTTVLIYKNIFISLYKMENLVINPVTKEYLRFQNNENLKSKIRLLYNQNNVILTNSGLHSNYLVITTIINHHDNVNIIYEDDLYHETITFLNFYKNIKLYKIDNNILNNTEILNQNNILFIESCSNPKGNIFDFSLIKKLREISLKLYVICDNTWLTSSIFNPFEYDIDIVTISLSKFYSGGNAICGCCLFKNNEDYLIVNNIIKISGIHISPLQLNIINEEIDYLEERIKNCSDLTYQTLEYLSQFQQIVISHPFLKQKDLVKKYFKNNLIPSIFIIGFKITEDKLLEIINKLNILSVETSFGSSLTKIDNYILKINNLSFIRLSIGYNDILERIKKGLNELIKYVDMIN